MRLQTLLKATSLAVVFATSALADSAALFLGNENYASLSDLRRGDEIANLTTRFERLGFDVQSLADGNADEMYAALGLFEDAANRSERLIVVLAGRFVHTSQDTYFLPTEARASNLTEVSRDAVALSQVLPILERTPGQAILGLATDSQAGATSPNLANGLGDFDIPQGVTVVTGAPRALRQAVERIAAVPGASLSEIADVRGITVDGYLAADQVFVTEAPVEAPSAPTVSEGTDRLADLLAWREADRLGTVEAYEGYLTSYPSGQFADRARDRIDDVQNTPEVIAEQTEESLNLTRDQRREIQRDLSLLDYNTRGIDGIFGRGTRAAISSWQGQNNYETTGFLSADQITRLDAQAERRAAELEEEAEQRRLERLAQDQAFWEETGAQGDEAGYRAYLNRFPDGEFADTAREELDAIERQKRAETNSRDRQLWDEASQENTIQSYRDYLVLAPNGAFRDEAANRIEELEEASRQSGALQQAIAEENALGLSQNTRRVIESRLERLGLKPGRVDGTFDDDTRRAIRRYQSARNLDETGYLNEAFVVQILADSVRSIFR